MSRDPVTDDDLAAMRCWRMGPWRGRRERWDLVPVTDLGLTREQASALFRAGLYTAGKVAEALGRLRRPGVFKDRGLRGAAEAAVRSAYEAAGPERRAIRAAVEALRGRPTPPENKGPARP